MKSSDGKYILNGVLQANQKSNGRIYDTEMYANALKDYQNRLIIEQREENIDSLIENRESKKVSIPISIGYDDKYNIKNIDIVDDKIIVDMNIQYTNNIKYLDLDINILPTSISSRGFTNSNGIS